MGGGPEPALPGDTPLLPRGWARVRAVSLPPSLSSRDHRPAPPRGLQDAPQVLKALVASIHSDLTSGGAAPFPPHSALTGALFSSKTTRLTPSTPRQEAPESKSRPAPTPSHQEGLGDTLPGSLPPPRLSRRPRVPAMVWPLCTQPSGQPPPVQSTLSTAGRESSFQPNK